ncbi:MAG: diphosphate--fructose-6-phosphate 1-phosphotransferase [Chlamydiales bacterium]|nr:diphosphate--fructose-6-phosphate 1-phosphotransferase [Chlamydiales bacterium]
MLTPLERARQAWKPQLPSLLQEISSVVFKSEGPSAPSKDAAQLKALFPHTFGQPVLIGEKGKGSAKRPLKVGVVLSGGQAAGGHNVIAGLFDALKSLHSSSTLLGFLNGPNGIIEGKYKELTQELIAPYRNQGGFDIIGSGRTKIESEEQLSAALSNMQKLKLDALVIIGGDDSNTNAALLAEYFLKHECQTRVVGVPKTIDGDLKNAYVEIPFGFDTACKTYAELIGNIARDALSAKKYTHFIKLMGRSASHITLECALATQPNFAIIGEECAEKRTTLKQLVSEICAVICKRAEQGKNYGVILIPEGLVEFLPEMKLLISELSGFSSQTPEDVALRLSPASKSCFEALPKHIQRQLLLERDPHGNIQLSLIETELLLIELVQEEIGRLKKLGVYKGKFTPFHHFFGYEGRAGFPSNFDASYCYALGHTAALLLAAGHTGYMAALLNLRQPVSNWQPVGVPLTMLMHLEMRGGREKPLIQKALVDLKGGAFKRFQKARESWLASDLYKYPGPIQFFGEAELTDSIPHSMREE